MKVVITLSPLDYDAVLFDLDGVLTRTASVHAYAWKRLFDSFLEQRSTQTGEPFVPFDIETDYPRYVDGKPRYDGVVAFLGFRIAGQEWFDERTVKLLSYRQELDLRRGMLLRCASFEDGRGRRSP